MTRPALTVSPSLGEMLTGRGVKVEIYPESPVVSSGFIAECFVHCQIAGFCFCCDYNFVPIWGFLVFASLRKERRERRSSPGMKTRENVLKQDQEQMRQQLVVIKTNSYFEICS